MKNNKLLVLLSLPVLLLSACTQPSDEEAAESGDQSAQTENTESTTNAILRNQLGDDYYLPALTEDGEYAPSQNRGITLNLNSGINISLFEKDLMRLSQSMFPTDEYLIQEGQKLTSEMVSGWLSREDVLSEEEQEELDPEEIARREFLKGLNPPESGEGDDRAPRYLNSILEFDFYSQTDSGPQFNGMSIGLAMNTVDYYRTEIGGPQYQQEIPEDVLLEQGQAMANEIVRRVRQVEELAEIPIFIGIYEQSAKDDLGGGVYVAVGQSTNGSTAIQNWDMLNEERLIFPLEGSDSSEGNAFANFRSEVEKFFPNLSGVTGQAHYVNENLQSLTINVMTQFYGATEIISFTQFLKQSATTFLPSDLDIEIVVESPQSVEAFLKKDRTETEYFSYVFN